MAPMVRTLPKQRLLTFLGNSQIRMPTAVNVEAGRENPSDSVDFRGRVNLLDLDEAGLRVFFESIDEKPFRAQQVLKWIYHHAQTDIGAMTNLGIALRQKLESCAEIKLPEILREQRSSDGTVKWLIGFRGGNAVETVYIPEPRRGTL